MPDTALMDLSGPIDWVARATEVAPLIVVAIPRTEADRKVPSDVMAAMHEAGLFRMVIPRSVGGGEVPIPELLQAIEVIAGADASAGWCLAQGMGCSRSAAYLDREIAREIFGPPDAVLAWGPPAGPMKAIAVEGGYRVSGKWQFASGLMNASWVGPTAPVFDQAGNKRIGADGKPESRCFLMPKSAVTVNDVWQVVGLRGTGSNGFAADDVFVPEGFTFMRDSAAYRREDALLYRIALTTYYGMAFASVALGIARPALDAFLELAATKIATHTSVVLRESPAVQREYAHVEAGLGSARAYLHERIRLLIDSGKMPEDWSPADRARLRIASTNAICKARDAVQWAYQAAGSAAIFDKNPFEKRLRDINSVAQQAQGQPVNFEHGAMVLMGLEVPGGRV